METWTTCCDAPAGTFTPIPIRSDHTSVRCGSWWHHGRKQAGWNTLHTHTRTHRQPLLILQQRSSDTERHGAARATYARARARHGTARDYGTALHGAERRHSTRTAEHATKKRRVVPVRPVAAAACGQTAQTPVPYPPAQTGPARGRAYDERGREDSTSPSPPRPTLPAWGRARAAARAEAARRRAAITSRLCESSERARAAVPLRSCTQAHENVRACPWVSGDEGGCRHVMQAGRRGWGIAPLETPLGMPAAPSTHVTPVLPPSLSTLTPLPSPLLPPSPPPPPPCEDHD